MHQPDLYTVRVHCSSNCCIVVLSSACTLETATRLVQLLDALHDAYIPTSLPLPEWLDEDLKKALSIWEGCDISAIPLASDQPTLWVDDQEWVVMP